MLKNITFMLFLATFKVLEGDGSSRKRNIEDSLECETCGMVMSSLNFLKRHMEKVHANKNQDNTQVHGDKNKQCFWILCIAKF